MTRRFDDPHVRASARHAAGAPRPAGRAAGLLLGLGLGGFVDGIVLHQILQWHNMGSAVLPPVTMAAMQRNMAWDGYFHAGSWLLSFAGVWRLWSDGRRARVPARARAFAGQLLLGWGLFNLVEGTLDHHVFEVHHVRDMPTHVPLYDWLFLGLAGVLVTAVGAWLARDDRVEFSRFGG